jgi:hypothetical protein
LTFDCKARCYRCSKEADEEAAQHVGRERDKQSTVVQRIAGCSLRRVVAIAAELLHEAAAEERAQHPKER